MFAPNKPLYTYSNMPFSVSRCRSHHNLTPGSPPVLSASCISAFTLPSALGIQAITAGRVCTTAKAALPRLFRGNLQASDVMCSRTAPPAMSHSDCACTGPCMSNNASKKINSFCIGAFRSVSVLIPKSRLRCGTHWLNRKNTRMIGNKNVPTRWLVSLGLS